MATVIDLRSDTVTRPTATMRTAMFNAVVGDDVYGEDPTVNELEATAARLLGKECALFVPTGTMGNTIAVKLHTNPGEEVIADARSHLLDYELGMTSVFSGCQIRTVDAPKGILTWDLIKPKLKKKPATLFSPTALIEIENTHNMAGGTVYDVDNINAICAQAHAQNIPVHMDGARVFNASVATGVSVAEIVRNVDTVMFCLSKGLGAPVGSILAGSAAVMANARMHRKRLGGGMRQAGMLAAAGLVALDEIVPLLATDHANAHYLAESLNQIKGLAVNVADVRTNIVFADVRKLGVGKAPVLSAELKARGVLVNAVGEDTLRFVTHYDAPRNACEKAMEIITEVVATFPLA